MGALAEQKARFPGLEKRALFLSPESGNYKRLLKYYCFQTYNVTPSGVEGRI